MYITYYRSVAYYVKIGWDGRYFDPLENVDRPQGKDKSFDNCCNDQ